MIYIKKKILFSLKEGFCKSVLDLNLIRSEVKFNIKFGVDCTKPQTTLGHSINLNKLKRIQSLNHTFCIIIGSFTASIGDPTDKSSIRFKIRDVHTYLNSKFYMFKFKHNFNKKFLNLKFNHQWLLKLNILRFLQVLEFIKVNYLLSRTDFKLRLAKKLSLSVKEVLYPTLQGYDSIQIGSCLELGGSDQLFNILIGRSMQAGLDLHKQSLLTCNLLPGLGSKEKMSKSLGNCIFIREGFRSMFSKLKKNLNMLEYTLKVFNLSHKIFIKNNLNNRKLLTYLFINNLSTYPNFNLKKNYYLGCKRRKVFILEKYFKHPYNVPLKPILSLLFKLKGNKFKRLVNTSFFKVNMVVCFNIFKKTAFMYKVLITFLGKNIALLNPSPFF